MREYARALAIIVALAMICTAQTQIATVSSDSPFQLRGANIPTGQGVPSWPVLPGDTITAGQTPVTITFTDGSTILLAPNSSAKVSLEGKTPEFQLTTGAVHYSLKTLTSVKLINGKAKVTPTDLVGDMQVGAAPISGWWTTGHTVAVIAGAAGAAALGIGVVTANGKTVSCKANGVANGCNGK